MILDSRLKWADVIFSRSRGHSSTFFPLLDADNCSPCCGGKPQGPGITDWNPGIAVRLGIGWGWMRLYLGNSLSLGMLKLLTVNFHPFSINYTLHRTHCLKEFYREILDDDYIADRKKELRKLAGLDARDPRVSWPF